jgi:hypothetical protein
MSIDCGTDGNKEEAYAFLRQLEHALNNSKPNKDAFTKWMKNAKAERPEAKSMFWEGLFLDDYVLPVMNSSLMHVPHMSVEKAKESFLAESILMRKAGCTLGSPASRNRHLFTKTFGLGPEHVAGLWWSDLKNVTTQSCPDWAMRSPYKIVFEGKLFRAGSLDVAKRELVNGIYECAYYRGHPTVPATKKHPAWDYDYACLVAYDASDKCSFKQAWDSIHHDIKDGCWNSENVFVMVIPISAQLNETVALGGDTEAQLGSG